MHFCTQVNSRIFTFFKKNFTIYLLLRKYYKIVTIHLWLANANKTKENKINNKEDETMCLNFSSCSELFNAICQYLSLGCQ